jgi:uncharacterized SAM-binding protein YcdF (DUF218 family)
MIARIRYGWLVCLAGLAAALWLGRAPLLGAAGDWLACGAPLQRVDYLLVMPGDQTTRPFAAAALARHGLADTVVIPRNAASPAVEDGIAPPTHEIIRRVLELRGVAAERIVVLDHHRTNSSWDDLRALADFLGDHPDSTAAVVTNDYHVRRTRWTARRVLGRASDVVVFGVPTDGFGPNDWWRYRGGVQMYLSEYCKLLVYWIRYGDPVLWTALAAAVIVIILVIQRKRAGGAVRGSLFFVLCSL